MYTNEGIRISIGNINPNLQYKNILNYYLYILYTYLNHKMNKLKNTFETKASSYSNYSLKKIVFIDFQITFVFMCTLL